MTTFPEYQDSLVANRQWDDLREFFNENGFVAFDAKIPEVAIDQAVAHIKAELGDGGRGRRQDTWKTCPAIHAIAKHPEIHEVLRELTGKAAKAFQTLIFAKGTNQRAHGDAHVHFDSWPERGHVYGAWIALQDVTADQGPLFYIEGSHKLPFINMDQLGVPLSESSNTFYEDAIARMIVHEGYSDMRREFVCRKGFCGVWAANLIHGGSLIHDKSSTRYSTVVHLTTADALYTPMLSDHTRGKIAMRNLSAILIK